MIIALIVLAVFLVVGMFFFRTILGGMFGLYRIVPVNEAHIRIMNNKMTVFSKRTGNSAYWVIPFITKLQKLPLSNIAIPVENIKLNDINMAKFMCDVMVFINIDNIELAVERLILTDVSRTIGFDQQALANDMRAMMESICRTVATKQDILTVYMNRQALATAIQKEVELVFPNWGIKLVNLELKHIKDAENSTIIADIEKKVAADISRDAAIRVATTGREAAVAAAEADETTKKRQIARDQAVELARQDAQIAIQLKTAEANLKQIEAKRKLEVGQAEIAKQITEQNAMAARIKVEQEAEAQKIKYQVEAEGQKVSILSVGQANADMVKAKLVAEAEGNLKLAEAMKAVNDTAMGVKQLDNQKEIQIAKFKAFGEALAKADIKWIMSGEKSASLFGLDLNAETGANLEQFLQQAGITSDKIQQVLSLIKK